MCVSIKWNTQRFYIKLIYILLKIGHLEIFKISLLAKFFRLNFSSNKFISEVTFLGFFTNIPLFNCWIIGWKKITTNEFLATLKFVHDYFIIQSFSFPNCNNEHFGRFYFQPNLNCKCIFPKRIQKNLFY